jgi:hypothetical protein
MLSHALLQQKESNAQTQLAQAALSAQPGPPVCVQHALAPLVVTQVPVVQGSLSSHGADDWQPPRGSQVSVVQPLPSSQFSGVDVQPVAGAQLSVVHTLPSSQDTGLNVQANPAPPSQLHAARQNCGSLASLTQRLSQELLQQNGSKAHTQF